jgi:hypothetical protein
VWTRRGKWGGGDSVWANSSSSARWSSGREITEETPNKRAEEAPNSAEETHRWAVCCPRGHGHRCPVVSGVRCATTLFATEAQGKAHQSKSREILYENSRLHMVSEGKQHLGRAVDGKYRCAASPDEWTIPQGSRWQISCRVRSCKKKCTGPTVCTKTPWSAAKVAEKFSSWVECTTCSNDLPGSGGRNQLLGGWFCGKGHWDEWMNGILLKLRYERLLQFLTGWYLPVEMEKPCAM